MSVLPGDLAFRPMVQADLAAALRIIAANDEDDAAEAKRSLRRGGAEVFVLERAGTVVGVSGFRLIDGTDRAYWLTWTYLDPAQRRVDLGASLVEQVLDVLRAEDARKVFATTSDFLGAIDRGPYEHDAAVFDAIGFREEMRHADYYAPREAMIGYGLRLQEEYEPEIESTDDDRFVEIADVEEIEECDGAYCLDWEFTEWSDDPLASIEAAVARARKKGARCVFLSAGSDATGVRELALSAGLHHAGRYLDFYEDGVHEDHYRLDL